MTSFDLKDGVTLSIAVLGAALGIINTANNLNQQKVKLRVTPKLAFMFPPYAQTVELGCIEVTNLSAFPVTVNQIGFTLDGGRLSKKKQKLVITAPRMSDNGPFPRRLESREAMTCYLELRDLKRSIGRAFAMTDCEEVAYGGNSSIKSMRQKAGQD